MKLSGLDILPSEMGFDVTGDSWRPNQLELAEQLLNSKKKIKVLQAPTGIGKSLINQIPGKWLDQRTLILTRTVQLQDQYGEQGMAVLYGRNRYMCARLNPFDPNATAADGVCQVGIYCGMMWDGTCDYYNQKYEAINADAACLNYAYFFKETSGGKGRFSGYDWLVLDEAHSLPTELTQSAGIWINKKDLAYIKLSPSLIDSVGNWIAWAHNNKKKLETRAKNKLQRKETYLAVHRILLAVDLLDRIENPSEWFTTVNDEGYGVTPIWPTPLAHNALWQHANNFILSSATIEPTYTAAMLGLEPDDIDVISTGGVFPASHRPIYIRGHYRVSRQSDEEDLLALVRHIDMIVSQYDGRGLIHTGNYALSLFIASHSQVNDRLMYHDSDNRLRVLDQFKSDSGYGKVLLSPSMTEGVDLPYELCVFQIVAKMPFANRGDPMWQARLNSDPVRSEFAYSGEAISSVVQACGRGMRAMDDYCDTYILDRAFSRLMANNPYRFPGFFTEAIKDYND